MADFKTHITVSSGMGILYGTTGFYYYDIPFEHAMIATGLCSVAGMLPDLDSGSSVPYRETLTIISVLTPVLMLPRFEALGMTREQIVFAAGFIYLFFRFVVGPTFLRYTKHRGMWHSIPAALIAGLATFLLCHSYEFEIRLFKSWAVVIGFVSHLLLDEIYAVNWEGKRIRVKRSFGTAIKMFSGSRAANLFTYGKLILLLALIFGDSYAMKSLEIEKQRDAAVSWFSGWFNQAANAEPKILR